VSFAFDPDPSDMSSFTNPAASGFNQVKELILPSSKTGHSEACMFIQEMAHNTEAYRREFIIFLVQDHMMCNSSTNHHAQ